MKSMTDRSSSARLRRLLPVLALTLLCLLCLSAQTAHAGVKAMLLINLNTGKTLYERNTNLSIPPASLTKLMTMYLAMDAVSSRKLSLMGKVRVTREAARTGGSSMHLRTGERVPLSRLMLGMAVASGNDAAMTVAHAISGSTRNFVRLMNRKARNLGLRHTVFKNPSGLPAPGQGALGIEVRADRKDLLELLAFINDEDIRCATGAERAVSRALGGSCQVPLAAHGIVENGELWLRAHVGDHRDGRKISAEARGKAADFEAVAEQVVADLKAQGAEALLAEVLAQTSK